MIVRDFDRDLLPVLLLAGDGTLFQRFAGHAGDPLDRTQQLNKCGQLVGAHIKHRTAAFGIIKFRVWMLELMAAAHHKRRRRDRPADRSVLDELQCRLDAGAKERFRRAADHQPALAGRGENGQAFLAGHSQRLLHVYMFASFQHL